MIVGFYNGEEPAATEFGRLVEADVTSPIMSAVSFAEVCNGLMRGHSVRSAVHETGWLREYLDIEPVTTQLAEAAARIKFSFHMSLGDTFAAVTALLHDAPLWTGDAELLCADGMWHSTDLRDEKLQRLHAARTAEGSLKVGRRTSGPQAGFDAEELADFIMAPLWRSAQAEALR